MSFGPNRTFIAGGTINPARFVTMSTTAAGFTCVQSTTGDLPVGIADYEGGVTFPTGSAVALANTGDSLAVWGNAQQTYLECGGSVTAADYLKSDVNGKGVTGTLGTDAIGAQALESGTSGAWIKVIVFTDK